MHHISLPTVLILQIAPLGAAIAGMTALELELTRPRYGPTTPSCSPTTKRANIFPHASNGQLCDALYSEINLIRGCRTWAYIMQGLLMLSFYGLLISFMKSKPFFSNCAADSPPGKVRAVLTCASSNFFPYMYGMWKMSDSLNVWKLVWFVHALIGSRFMAPGLFL